MVTDESETQPEYKVKHRDDLLYDIRMFGVQRMTTWKTGLSEIKCFNKFSQNAFDSYGPNKMQVHYHNWVITSEMFNSCRSLQETFNVVGVDDGLPQGIPEEQCTGFQEFVLVIEAKDHPIHAWLTHPESVLSVGYKDAEPDQEPTIMLQDKPYVAQAPTILLLRDERREFCSGLSDSFIALCQVYAE